MATGLGSVFDIDQKVLDKAEQLDKHIQNLDTHFAAAAQSATAFVNAVNPLQSMNFDNLNGLATVLGQLKGVTFGADLSQQAKSAKDAIDQMNASITAAIQNCQKLAAEQKKTGSTGQQGSSSSQGQGAAPTKGSIAYYEKAIRVLKQYRNGLKVDYNDGSTFSNVSKKIDEFTQKLKEARKYTGISVSVAISNAQGANTINDMVKALKDLKAVRDRLNTETPEFQKANAEIAKLTQRIREARNQSEGLKVSFASISGVVGNMAASVAAAFSLNAIGDFMKSIAEVRANFDIQQTSLEAILQDKPKADALFNKTVSLAVQSPFTVQQLVSYTRQLAAYRIESDKLYDTTKRLADVSAGLGVDMQRLILAYGQVKAAEYLKGTEVRQFTEAGVNMYGELQSYFKEVKGESYSVAQIFKMISDHKVTFEDVEAVFKRMTSEGGLFFDMQAVQSETLRGKIMNLKDSYDIMLNTLGEENEGIFKGAIDATKALMDNFDKIVPVLKSVLSLIVALKLHSIQTGVALSTMASKVADPTLLAAPGIMGKIKSGLQTMKLSTLAAGEAFKILGKNILGALASNWPVLVLMAIADAAMTWYNNQQALNKALKESAEAYVTMYNKLSDSKKQFEEAGDNIDAQKQALKDLIKVAQDAKLEVKIDVEKLNQDEVVKQYDELQERLKHFNSLTYGISVTFDHGAGKDLKDDLEDLGDAASEMQLHVNDVVAALKYVQTGSGKLSETLTKEIQGMSLSRDDYQTQAEYLEALADKIVKIKNEIRGGTTGPRYGDDYLRQLLNSGGFFDSIGGAANDMVSAFGDVDDAVNKTYANITNSVQDWQQRLQDNPADFKLALDTELAEQDLGEIEAEIARKKLYAKFGLQVDEENIQETLDNTDAEIRKYLADHTYSIDVTITTSTEDFLSKLAKGVQGAGQEAEKGLANLAYLYKKIKNGETKIKVPAEEAVTMGLLDRVVPGITQNEIQVDAQKVYDYLKQKYTNQLDEALKEGYEKKGSKSGKKTSGGKKNTRDIPSERLSLLKTMQSEYESLLDYFSSEDANKLVLDTFGKQAKELKLQIADNLLPDRAAVIAKMKELAGTIADASKKNKALQDIAKIEIKFNEEDLKDKLEKAGKEADSAISGLDLFNKFKDLGLSTGDIKKFFPSIVTNYKQAAQAIDNAYAGIEKGENAVKALREQHQKLLNKQIEDSRKNVEELVKNYGVKLSEQLQLDMWYYQERAKIRNAYVLDESGNKVEMPDDMKKRWEENLTKEYRQKTQKNIFEDFKGSETYVTVLQNVENLGTQTIVRLQKRLEELKSSLTDLDPSQMKEIAESIDKLQEQKVKLNPLKYTIDGIKEVQRLTKAGRTEDFLNTDIINRNKDNADLTQQNNGLALEMTQLQQAIDLRQQNADITSLSAQEQATLAQYEGIATTELQKQLKTKRLLAGSNNVAIQANNTAINQDEADLAKYSQARKAAEQLKATWEEVKNSVSEAWQQVSGLLEAMGVDLDGDIDFILEIGGAFLTAAEQAVGLYVPIQLQNAAKREQISLQQMLTAAVKGTTVAEEAMGVAANSALGVIGWIALALQAVVSLMTAIFKQHDKKLEKQIEKLKDDVDALADSYDKLHDAMVNAMSFHDIVSNNRLSEANINQQIRDYQKMISLEAEKKDSDEEKIKEYRDNIKELEEQRIKLQEEYTESLGGFGSAENYKEAAQDFIDAWVDAFNEGEDGLDALEESFNDFYNTLLKKQLMLKASETFIKPLLTAFDEAVSQESEGGVEVTQSELAAIQKLKDQKLSGLNDYLTQMMDILGVTPDNTTSNLSELQQGIEGITETTAEALEAYLNSMRFFLATQQGDVAAIRALLEANYGGTQSQGVENPTLVELRGQTELLKAFHNSFTSVMKAGHSMGGYGLKVFM